MAISRLFVLPFVVSFLAGCSSGDPHQKIVRVYLARQHGSDPVTIVKSYGTAQSDEKLVSFLETMKGLAVMSVEQAEGFIEDDKVQFARLQKLGLPVVDALDARLKSAEQLLTAKRRLSNVERLQAQLPFTATRLVYRVPDDRGQNSLNDRLFIIREAEVDFVVDLLDEGHLFHEFGRRAFPD